MGAAHPGAKLGIVSLLDLAGAAAPGLEGCIHHLHSMAPARVPVAELLTGARYLDAWRVNSSPSHIDWRERAYDSMAPASFVFRNVLLHSSAGIVQIDQSVLLESLAHTRPDIHGYERLGSEIVLHPRRVTALPGTHIAILAGNASNYFHAMLDCAARLFMLPQQAVLDAESVLHPSCGAALEFVLRRLSQNLRLPARPVADSECLLVETLVYPWSVHGDCDFHPCVNRVFDTIADSIGPAQQAMPRRIYIDRRGTSLRRLLNEEQVIAGLHTLGFVPVRPESLKFADQVRLFRNADAIVAPHGAGLTNLGYCRPGTLVLELLMDGYVNWCYRRLAAVRQLRYDCVLGRCAVPWDDGATDVHALPWIISPGDVAGAAAFLLGC